jgi:hypothetical protein
MPDPEHGIASPGRVVGPAVEGLAGSPADADLRRTEHPGPCTSPALASVVIRVKIGGSARDTNAVPCRDPDTTFLVHEPEVDVLRSHRPSRCGAQTRLRPLGQAPSDAGRTVSGVPRCLISEDTSPPRPADRAEDKACARSPVHKAQQEGPSRYRRRPLTCVIGSGGRI